LQKTKSKLSESFPYLIAIGAVYLSVQIITGGNYPIFRDEYYYIDCAKHIAFGYVDHPSLSIAVLTIWKFIFGDSQFSIRIIPALLGALTIILGGFIASEMGGSKKAQIFTAISVLCSPAYLGLASIYSMNSFDLVFWALMFYGIIKIINTGNEKLWLWFGLIAGLGLMNKISVGYLGAGLVIAMLITKERKWFRNKYFWFGGIIAGIIFLPYIIWNMQNDFASIEFIHNATKFKNVYMPPLDFLKEQILQMNPINAPVWITGIAALFISKTHSKYRAIAITYIVILIILLLNNGKPYYLAAAYISLIPAGSIVLTEFFERKRLKFLIPAYAVILIIVETLLSPVILPVLSPDGLAAYIDKIGMKPSSGEKSKQGILPQFMADHFGWEELAQEMSRVYNALSEDEKKKTVIAVSNYGEASSLNYYAKKYGLPKVYCAHNNHWIWAYDYGFDGIENIIILGGKREDHLEKFDNVTEAGKTADNPYAMPYETNLPIFIARRLKPEINLKEVWKKQKEFI